MSTDKTESLTPYDETSEYWKLRPWARPGGPAYDCWPLTDEQRRTLDADIEASRKTSAERQPPPPSIPADTHEYSCGDPGHDYTDHLVVHEGVAILDINLPAGEKARPLTGPSWTEVDPEIWSDEYKETHAA